MMRIEQMFCFRPDILTGAGEEGGMGCGSGGLYLSAIC